MKTLMALGFSSVLLAPPAAPQRSVVGMWDATVTVNGDREIVGFCFTPQDGNSLASSIAAALWLMEPDFDRSRLSVLDRFFFREI